jgi:hypothetical protein
MKGICPKCKEGEIQEQTSIRGILFWKKKEVIFYCPLCNFENVRKFKVSKKDIEIHEKTIHNKMVFKQQLEDRQKAVEFLNSIRGRYILSQALYYAIKEMRKVKSPHREVSNIANMEFLRDNLFNIFTQITKRQLKMLRARNG